MKKVNPLKLTVVVIPLAIILTILVRYIVGVILGQSIHPAITLVIYIILFAALTIVFEKVVGREKWSWFLSEKV